LLEDIEKAWRERESAFPLERIPTFRDNGLVLGAGSILLAANPESGRFIRLEGGADARLLVLLAAAYRRTIGPEVLGHVRRAATRWREGDAALASVHLALAGLGPLSNPRESARRLFLAERLLGSNAEPVATRQALGIECAQALLHRTYSPDEPRVPAGNGPGYAGQLKYAARSEKSWGFVKDWLDQSLDELASAQSGRHIVWMFAEPESAQFAYDLFHREDKGRENITIAVFPYLGG
jgi:hypothetical protein